MNAPPRLRRPETADASLSVLLLVQAATQFGVLPLGAVYPRFRILLDLSHLVFAGVRIAILTRHRGLQGALLVGLALLAGGPLLWDPLSQSLGLDSGSSHEVIPITAFGFNALVTAIVIRHVFGPGRITAHRLQGAVLIYLNVAALFAIGYGLLEAHAPGAITSTAGIPSATEPAQPAAALSYFSLATITTTGYGDLAPIHPLARGLVNLEAVFGALFPATVLARLVGLHLFHAKEYGAGASDAVGED